VNDVQEYSTERLGNSIEIAVTDDHTFGTDAMLLNHFTRYRKNEVACDLGTGCGILPLLWCRGEVNHITAVDIQQKACEQLKYSIKQNSLEDKIEVYNIDLKEISEHLPREKYNLVTMNPPYFKINSGKMADTEASYIARHEVKCNLEDIIKAADYLLKYGGRLCMCHRAERMSELLNLMTEYSIEPKRLRLVSQRADTAPWLVLVEGKKGGKSGIKIEPGLFMYDGTDNYTKEVREKILYNKDY